MAAPCVWLAELDGESAGFAMADAEEGCVFAAFVRPEFEGWGVGRLLLAKVEDFPFQHHQKIWLETDGKSRANGFYQRLGWMPVEFMSNGGVRLEKHRPSNLFDIKNVPK